MPEDNGDRNKMTEHDLLIRIDERVETLQKRCDTIDGRLEAGNKLKPRIARLEAAILAIAVAGGGTAAGLNFIG